jgi:acyl-coenzyme A synthetase/AMP-(fatty) acid ligase
MSELLLDRLSKHAAKAHSSKRAVAFLGPAKNGGKIDRELSYSEIESKTSELAQHLLEKGLKKGDR